MVFLDLLSLNEKKTFIGLAYHAAISNGVIDKFEKEMISKYYLEMGFKESENPITKIPLKTLLSEFSKSSDIVKRVVYIEILAVCLSDGLFEKGEQIFMNIILNEFELSEVFKKSSKEWVQEMFTLVSEGNDLINGLE